MRAQGTRRCFVGLGTVGALATAGLTDLALGEGRVHPLGWPRTIGPINHPERIQWDH